MSEEFKRIWKEKILAYWRYYPGIFLEELRKYTANQS
jgi:hypothetical protein